MHLPRFLASLLRTARWHRRGIGVLAGVVCLLAITSALAPANPPSVTVLVCTDELSASVRLSATQFQVQRRPTAFVPRDALRDPAQATGKMLVVARSPGSILTEQDFLSPHSNADAGESLVPFRVRDSGVVALINVGDRITVVSVSPDGQQNLLATSIRVAALPQKGPDSAAGLAQTGQEGALIVVAADPATARRLAASATQLPLAVILG